MTEDSNNNQATPAVSKPLTKEQRSQIATEAAKRRWAKQKRATKAAGSKRGTASKRSKLPKHKSASKSSSNRREFSTALKAAEKRLAAAIQERDEAANRYAMKNAEIPSLVRIIAALKGPSAQTTTMEGLMYGATGITLEQIVAGEPIGRVNPPRRADTAPPAAIPIPQPLHPANQTLNRAQGGAIGVELQEEEDEDVHLRASGVAGGEWH